MVAPGSTVSVSKVAVPTVSDAPPQRLTVPVTVPLLAKASRTFSDTPSKVSAPPASMVMSPRPKASASATRTSEAMTVPPVCVPGLFTWMRLPASAKRSRSVPPSSAMGQSRE